MWKILHHYYLNKVIIEFMRLKSIIPSHAILTKAKFTFKNIATQVSFTSDDPALFNVFLEEINKKKNKDKRPQDLRMVLAQSLPRSTTQIPNLWVHLSQKQPFSQMVHGVPKHF